MVAFGCSPPAVHRLPSTFLGSPLLHPEKQFSSPSLKKLAFQFRFTALFWRPKRTPEPRELNPSLGAYTLTMPAPEVSAQNLKMRRFLGHEIKAEHWDSFYKFYRNTTDNKWGSAYLTRDFFHNLVSKMKDHILLVVAEDDSEIVAGALNLIGGDTLFGRLWGCQPHSYFPNLHFEACYYQAIEAAIELRLNKVEAGAQGEHKIQRGYLPVTTFSSHYIVDDDFRKAIGKFLTQESRQVRHVIQILLESGPFKEGNV